jgi:hypothetical protein
LQSALLLDLPLPAGSAAAQYQAIRIHHETAFILIPLVI